jgi:Gly-Xaa carboxypeptidase
MRFSDAHGRNQGIGYLSSLITALEAHPFPVSLKRTSTYFKTLQCTAAYDDSLPSDYRALVAKASTDDAALAEVEAHLLAENPDFTRAKMGTTQAIDLVNGGVKVNALPEHVWAVANHRIADWRWARLRRRLSSRSNRADNTYSNPAEVRTRYVNVLAPVAAGLNLTLDAWGIVSSTNVSVGRVTLSDIYDVPLAPAPVTPAFGSPAWGLLSGTILSTIGSHLRANATRKPTIVGPELAIGNTGACSQLAAGVLGGELTRGHRHALLLEPDAQHFPVWAPWRWRLVQRRTYGQ